VAKSLSVDGDQVTFSYEVTGADLTPDTAVGLYWARGADVTDATQVAHEIPIIGAGKLKGSHSLSFAFGNLSNPTPPDGTTHILAIADPGSVIGETLEDNNAASQSVVDIVVSDVTTTDFQTFSVDVVVTSPVPNSFRAKPFELSIYQSVDSVLDDTDILRKQGVVIGLNEVIMTNQTVPVDVDAGVFGIPAGESLGRFVVIVADWNGDITEIGEDPGGVGDNNAAFAIPLFALNESMNRAGDKAPYPRLAETDSIRASGPFDGLPWLPGVAEQSLVSVYWPFEFEEDISYKVQWPVQSRLFELVELIYQDQIRRPDFWVGKSFGINSTYRTTGRGPSLHWQGRAVDFDVYGPPLTSNDELSRFSGLVWLAGFDWVWNEPCNPLQTPDKCATVRPSHVHASMREAVVGDGNFDGVFGSSDLIGAFQSGKYETGGRARWEDGDWNADGVFDSGDLVAAFQAGRYEQSAPASPIRPIFINENSEVFRLSKRASAVNELDLAFVEWKLDERLTVGP
jgi:hypothetical protein